MTGLWVRFRERSGLFPRAPSPLRELMAFSDRQRCSTAGSFGSWPRHTRWLWCRFSIRHLSKGSTKNFYFIKCERLIQRKNDLFNSRKIPFVVAYKQEQNFFVIQNFNKNCSTSEEAVAVWVCGSYLGRRTELRFVRELSTSCSFSTRINRRMIRRKFSCW